MTPTKWLRVEKLLKALRSGKYAQTRGILNKNNQAFCCLGVACEIFSKENKIIKNQYGDIIFYGYASGGTFLPERVRDWFGFASGEGRFFFDNLASLNDDGIPFDQIANLIESNPPGLFEGEDEENS